MARFAASRRPIRLLVLHTLLELILVRILVATGAFQILPVIDHGGLGLELSRFFVAVAARYCNVRSGEHEVCLFVLRQSKRGRFVAFKIVAAIARVQVRRRSELSGVAVAMAIRAGGELDFE